MPDTTNVRWVEPFAYKAGEPFRIMPVGEFKRGKRLLTITRERLQAFADNLKAGRPRWKPPIYTGHPTNENQDPPKVGNIVDLVVKPDGLYAVPELTEQGGQLLTDGAYQYNSPGVLWDLNGTTYADEHGQEFTNVLDHVALTNRPWFGENTALFSAAPLPEMLADNSDAHLSAMKKTWKKIQALAAPLMALLAEDGWMSELTPTKKPATSKPDGYQYAESPANDELRWRGEELVKALNCLHDLRERWGNDMTIGPQVRGAHDALKSLMVVALDAFGSDARPGTQSVFTAPSPVAEVSKGKDIMADIIIPAPTAPEKFTISAEEFAAVKAKADKADALSAQAEQFTTQLKAADERARSIERARRRDQLIARCETFSAVPESPETLAEKFQALEEASPELFKFFDGLLAAMDTQVATGGLFSQKSSPRAPQGGETFEAATDKVLAEEFGGDRAKYAEAMNVVAKRRPDLFAEYSNTYSARRKGA